MTSADKQCQSDTKTSPKVKSSGGPGMKTDQAVKYDALLNQSAMALNKNQEAKETDASPTLKRDNKSPSPLDNRDL